MGALVVVSFELWGLIQALVVILGGMVAYGMSRQGWAGVLVPCVSLYASLAQGLLFLGFAVDLHLCWSYGRSMGCLVFVCLGLPGLSAPRCSQTEHCEAVHFSHHCKIFIGDKLAHKSIHTHK